MATNNTDQKSTPVAPGVSPDVLALAQAIIESNKASVEAMKSAAPPRQLTIDEFKAVTPFNPNGTKNRQIEHNGRKEVVVYQNGNMVNVDSLHDEEIRLIGLLRPGRFLNGLTTVSFRQLGGSEYEIHINSKASRPEDRMTLAIEGGVRSFTELLKLCVAEATQPTATA